MLFGGSQIEKDLEVRFRKGRCQGGSPGLASTSNPGWPCCLWQPARRFQGCRASFCPCVLGCTTVRRVDREPAFQCVGSSSPKKCFLKGSMNTDWKGPTKSSCPHISAYGVPLAPQTRDPLLTGVELSLGSNSVSLMASPAPCALCAASGREVAVLLLGQIAGSRFPRRSWLKIAVRFYSKFKLKFVELYYECFTFKQIYPIRPRVSLHNWKESRICNPLSLEKIFLYYRFSCHL